MGRPKGFERDEVLDRAIEVFRRKGYEGASVQDLVDATGVNRFGLYDTFGDKHGLFLEALRRYHLKRRNATEALLGEAGPRLPQLRKYFEAIWDQGPEGQGNCLMVNSAVELARNDPLTAGQVEDHFSLLEEIFLQALLQAKEQGEIDTDRDLRAVARFLINNARGMRVIVKYTHDRSVFEDIISVAFSVLNGKC